MRQRIVILVTLVLAFPQLLNLVHGQDSQDEHSQHHPEENEKTQGNGKPSTENTPGEGGMMQGGMGGMMDSMMEKMGAPTPKELYPDLMTFPSLTPEERVNIQHQAHERMKTGAALLAEGLDELTNSAPTDDFAAMQAATSKMREGLAQFESGLAAHRAIAEGKSPQSIALQWFKREMNLLPPAGSSAPGGLRLFGMSLFHAAIMLALVLFACAMIWMYFFKMRRASALLEQLVSEASIGSNSANAVGVDTTNVASTALDEPKLPATDQDVSGNSCCDNPKQPCTTDCAETCDSNPADEGSVGLLPVSNRRLCRLRVAKIYEETAEVKTFRLVACDGGPIPFSYLPGQFLTLTLPVGDKPIRRSYTIASSPTQGYHCEITVKREDQGAGSRYLHDSVSVGDTLEVQAPSGKFIFRGDEADEIVLIAGGVGITPMMSITRALTDMGWPGDIYLVVACRNREHFIFESELQQLQQRHTNLHVFAALSQVAKTKSPYHTGRLTRQMLEDWVPNLTAKRIHICGPAPMMDAVKTILSEVGVSNEKIHTENFGSEAKPKRDTHERKPEDSDTTLPTVTFDRSDKSILIASEETLLEVAERAGVEIDYSCRVGMCGVCAVKVLSGKVSMEVDDGLDHEDRKAGKVLACQAHCNENIVIDA